MTAIAAITDGTDVWIGADSAGVSGQSLTIRADEKVFTSGPYVFGFTTSFRMGQLLRYRLEPPEPPAEGDLLRFMCTDFTDAVRECLKAGGWALKDKDREEGGNFLVGVAGRLFEMWPDYQVSERAASFTATGCGEDLALGALHATEGRVKGAADRLLIALAAAERFSVGVAEPFHIVSTPDPS